MKRFVIILFVFTAFNLQAQDKQEMKKRGQHDFTPEQVATLKTKKMTLHLNLSESQQSKIYNLNLEQAQNRKAKLEEKKSKGSSEERSKLSQKEKYKIANNRLDAQIAQKKAMRNVLNEEQFAKWEKGHKINKKLGHRRIMKRKRNSQMKGKRAPRKD